MGHFQEPPKLVHPDFAVPNRKPVGAVEIDPQYQCVFSYLAGNHGLTDIAKGRMGTEIVGSVGRGPDHYYSGDVVSYGDISDLDGSRTMSVLLRIKPDNWNVVAGILNKRTAWNSQNCFSIGTNYNNNLQLSFQVGSGSGVDTAYYINHAGFSTTEFTTLLLTYNADSPATNRMRFFKDGVEQSTSIADGGDAGGPLVNTSSALEIGRVNNGTLRYTGSVSHIAVFRSDLSYIGRQASLDQNFYLKPANPITYFIPSAGGGPTILYDEYYKTLLSGSMM